jgi:sucrose-6-phosphate hydrolase SacC (GH32 family)
VAVFVPKYQLQVGSIDREAVKAPNHRIKFHVFVDRSSIEVFANNGEMTMTSLIFPDSLGKGFELFSNGGTVKLLSLDVYQLKSRWSS